LSVANVLKDIVIIKIRTRTQTALGETINWTPIETRHARVISLDAKSIVEYMQLKSDVTHKIIFRDPVTIGVGDNLISWKDKTLEPQGPVQKIDDMNVILVKEV